MKTKLALHLVFYPKWIRMASDFRNIAMFRIRSDSLREVRKNYCTQLSLCLFLTTVILFKLKWNGVEEKEKKTDIKSSNPFIFFMINYLDFNRTNDFYAISKLYGEINNIKICVHTQHRKFRLRLMFMGTRENIVLSNDSMSPLMRWKSVFAFPRPRDAPRGFRATGNASNNSSAAFGKIARIDGESLWKIKVRREVHPSMSLSQAVDLTNVHACLNATVQKGYTLTP